MKDVNKSAVFSTNNNSNGTGSSGKVMCDKCTVRVDKSEMRHHDEDNKDYCIPCFDYITHAEKYGRAIDIWEAKNVE